MAKKITLEEMQARIASKIENATAAQQKELIFSNTEKGVYFSFDGITGYFLENQQILTAVWDKLDDKRKEKSIRFRATAEKLFNAEALLVKKIEKGKRKNYTGNFVKMYNPAIGNVYFFEKELRQFPKNCCFYISGKYNPVLIGMMDQCGYLHIFALVMPVRMLDTEFIAAEEATA